MIDESRLHPIRVNVAMDITRSCAIVALWNADGAPDAPDAQYEQIVTYAMTLASTLADAMNKAGWLDTLPYTQRG